MFLLVSTDSLKQQAASTGRRAAGALLSSHCHCITASPSSTALKPRGLTGMEWAWLAWGSQWAGSPWEGTFQPYFCNLPWKKVRSPCYYKKNAIFQSQFFLTFLFYRKKSFSWVLLNLNQLYHFQAQDQNPLFGLSSSKLETLKLSSLSEIDI